jgi:hypothetical protein
MAGFRFTLDDRQPIADLYCVGQGYRVVKKCRLFDIPLRLGVAGDGIEPSLIAREATSCLKPGLNVLWLSPESFCTIHLRQRGLLIPLSSECPGVPPFEVYRGKPEGRKRVS